MKVFVLINEILMTIPRTIKFQEISKVSIIKSMIVGMPISNIMYFIYLTTLNFVPFLHLFVHSQPPHSTSKMKSPENQNIIH